MNDLFEEEAQAYWADKEFKSWVVTVGWYPRGCWVTGTKVTKPRETYTTYVRSATLEGASVTGKNWAAFFMKKPVAKCLVDRIRLMGPEDIRL